MNYPEINKLRESIENHSIEISEPLRHIRNTLFFVRLTVDGKSWEVLVDDEFQDFAKGSLTLRWFLVLFALDLFKEAEDILVWGREHTINPQEFLQYYKDLPTMYSEIEALVGDLDPQISDFDYTLRAGAYQELTRNHGSH